MGYRDIVNIREPIKSNHMELKSYFTQDNFGNAVQGATVYVYLPNTRTLVTGLAGPSGDPLTNPTASNVEGLVQFRAPNGIYDLRVVTGAKDYTISVQFNDVTDTITTVADAADRAGAFSVDAMASVVETQIRLLQAQQTVIDAGQAAQNVLVSKVNAADLLNPSKGSGMVKHDDTVDYPVGTVGDKLKKVPSATFVSSEADRAKTAADAATVSAGVYASTAAGLLPGTGVAQGMQFQVVSADGLYITRYLHAAGPTAVPVATYPSANYVDVVSYALGSKASGSPRKNLFNPASPDVALGYFPVNTTGLLQANAAYNTTGYIPIVAGQQYTVSQKQYLCWYNVNKQFISGTSSVDTAVTQTAPAGAFFMRCSGQVGANWNVFQVENGAAQTLYEAYKFDVALNDGIVKKQHLADGIVSSAKTDFLKPGKNSFNKTVATVGNFVSPTTGTLSPNALYDTSDFIAVVPGTAYKSSHGIRFSCYFAANGSTVVAGGIDDNTGATTSFAPPVNAAFVRISFNHANIDAFQVEVGTVSTTYAEYGYKILGPNGEGLASVPVGLAVIDTANLVDSAVAIAKTNFIKLGKNLYNKATATVGGFINPTTGSMAGSASFDTSALIPVTPGTAYKSSHGIRFSCYFAANGSTVISGGINDNTQTTTSFTPPTGVAYVRISLGHAYLNLFQLEAGAVATAYEAYGYKVLGPNGETLIGPNVAIVSTWAGKSWASLGDSITQQAKWQGPVVTALGLISTNFGVGGTKVTGAPGDTNAMCQDARIDLIPTTTDLISVMGGTNDWAQNVTMGTPASVDPLTFNGALNTMVTKLMARFPAKRVVLFTTPYGEMYDYIPRGWSNAYTNTQGLTTRDYADAIRSACKRWGLPCVDVNMDAGWNTLNIRTFVTDDGALLHPNTDGGKRIAEVAVGGLRSIEPTI